mgnify:CR=1 FL=1
MKKKKFLLAGILLILVWTLCGCGGKAPSLTYDGSFELRLGKTKAGEVLDAGFTNLYSNINDKQIGSMSWENLYAMKGNVTYGTMYAGNKSSSEKGFRDGVIFRVIIEYDDPDYETGEILINGVNFEGYTREQVREAMSDFEITLDYGEYLVFESGKYEYSFAFSDGSETVTRISINDGTEAELTIG